MKTKDTSYTLDKAPDFTMVESIPWITKVWVDYERLVNKPTITSSFFCADIWALSWATWDATYRDVNIPSSDGLSINNTNITLIVWLWLMTATLSRSSTISPSGNIFTIPAWKICKINVSPNSSTSRIKINYTWGIRFIRWTTSVLSQSDPEFWFLATTEVTFTIQFATTASDRPIFWVLIEVL